MSPIQIIIRVNGSSNTDPFPMLQCHQTITPRTHHLRSILKAANGQTGGVAGFQPEI